MKKSILLITLFMFFVAGTAQAALDIDLIFMTSVKEHLDGFADSTPWCFEVWVELDDPGTLDHIDITLPGGSTTYTIDASDYWEYESPDYSTIGDLQAVYPTGDYLFSFEDSGDGVLNTVTLDYNGLSKPLNIVSFTSPAHEAMDVHINPTFTWTIDPGDGDALGMWLDNGGDWYEDVPAPMTTTSWTPGSLDPTTLYYLEVSVFGAGATVGEDTVGGDTFEYALVFEYLNEIEFTTVPEPATVALLGIGALSLLRRRKR